MANRHAPWVEARVTSTANTDITAAGEVAITGATVTITAKLATRFHVTAVFRLSCIAFTAVTGVVRGKLRVGGTALVPEVSWSANAVDEQCTITGCWTIDVAAGSTTTVDLALDLGGTNDNDYRSVGNHTGLVLLGMPSEGISY